MVGTTTTYVTTISGRHGPGQALGTHYGRAWFQVMPGTAPLIADEQNRAHGAESQARERGARRHALLAHRRVRVARQVPHSHLPPTVAEHA